MTGPVAAAAQDEPIVTRASTCWECSVNCGSIVRTRGAEIVEVGPDPRTPTHAATSASRASAAVPASATMPIVCCTPCGAQGPRGSGQWQRISWDEALDEIADRFAEIRRTYGPEALVGATSGAYFSRSVITALLMRSIGSPNWMINQDLCGGCRAVSARVTGLDIDAGGDIANTQCALVVGRNLAVADPVGGRR